MVLNVRWRLVPFRASLVFGVLSSGLFVAVATPPAQVKKAAPYHSGARIYSQLPFTGTIAKGFRGNDPRAIFQTIAKVNPVQSEYETIGQYQARLIEIGNSRLYGDLRVSSDLVFVVPSEESNEFIGNISPSNLRSVYDANTQMMTTMFSFEGMHQPKESFAAGSRAINWGSHLSNSGSYVASNAFGAVEKVTTDQDVETALSIDLPSPFYNKALGRLESSVMGMDVPVSFSVAPEKARSLKDNLRAAVVVKLVPPYIIASSSYSAATFDNAMDLKRVRHYLKCEIADVILFDKATGAVVARLPR